MIDLHGHYLPWVGDGPGSLEEGLLMLRMAEADGVRLAVLTPTFDPGCGPLDRAGIEKKFAAFRMLAERRRIRLRLELGAELIHGAAAIAALDRDEIPFVGQWEGRKVVLLRWAEAFVPVGAISAVEQMLARGVLPMLAGPERNPGVVRSPGTLDYFLRDGCLVQIHAGSLLGWYGPEVRDTAFRLIEAGKATVLASGASDATTRPPMLQAGRDLVAQHFGRDLAEELTQAAPSRIVDTQAADAEANLRAAMSDAVPDSVPVLSEVDDTPPVPEPVLEGPPLRGEERNAFIGSDGLPILSEPEDEGRRGRWRWRRTARGAPAAVSGRAADGQRARLVKS